MTIKLVIAEAYDLGDGRRQYVVEVNDYPARMKAVPLAEIDRSRRSEVKQLSRTPFEFTDTSEEDAFIAIRSELQGYIDRAKDTPEVRAQRPAMNELVGKVL